MYFSKMALAVGCALCVSVSSANAALVLVAGSPASGNDSEAALLADFGITTTQLGRINTPGTIEDGAVDASAVFSVSPDDGAQAGTFSYDLTGTDYQLDFVVLKGGGDYSVFTLMAGADPFVGSMLAWAMNETGITVGSGRIPNLSHITFYGSRAAPVPLPAAAPFFISGLIGAGALRHRRRKSGGKAA